MLVAELGDDLVPMGGITEDRGGDPAAMRPCEDSGCRVVARRVEALLDERPDLADERYNSCTLALGAFIDETTGARCRLPSDGP